MEEKYYKISEKELLSLLENNLELEYLEQEGIDNWTWYGEGRPEFIIDALGISESEYYNGDYSMTDVAEKELKNYEEV